jgi:hypothetical protein
MNTTHRQNIESAWDNLLDAVAEAAQEAKSDYPEPSPVLNEIAARLDTLHAALRGLSNAWTSIRDLLPAEPAEDVDKSEVPGSLPQSAYYKPLAKVLLHLGGSASTRDTITAVGKFLKGKLTPVDFESLTATGQTRWIVNVRFARLQLKANGLIRANTEHGQWELTDAGKRWAADDCLPLLPAPIPQPDPDQQLLPF